MEILKASFKRKISNAPQRRKIAAAKRHPYIRNLISREVVTELSVADYSTELESIRLRCDRPVSAIDLEKELPQPTTSRSTLSCDGPEATSVQPTDEFIPLSRLLINKPPREPAEDTHSQSLCSQDSLTKDMKHCTSQRRIPLADISLVNKLESNEHRKGTPQSALKRSVEFSLKRTRSTNEKPSLSTCKRRPSISRNILKSKLPQAAGPATLPSATPKPATSEKKRAGVERRGSFSATKPAVTPRTSLFSSSRAAKSKPEGQGRLPCIFPNEKIPLTPSSSAVALLFPSGILPANVINPLLSPVQKDKQNTTSNLFQKFRRRAGKSKLFSSLRGRNEIKSSSALESLNETQRESPDIDTTMSHDVEYAHADGTALLRPSYSSKLPQSGVTPLDLSGTVGLEQKAGEIIPPPTPFRMLITSTDSDRLGSDTTNFGVGSSSGCATRTISSELRNEIELSLLHWPSDRGKEEQSVRSLNRPCRTSRTLPKLSTESSGCAGLPLPHSSVRTYRPLSWSCDMTEAEESLTQTATSQSNYSMGVLSPRRDSYYKSLSMSSYAPSLTGSYTTITGSDNALADAAGDSDNTLISEEFGDAITALRSFESKKKCYSRETRRMSQPHPIKIRSRLPSEDSVQSLQLPQVTRCRRVRSKSEPARLVHEEIRQNFCRELSKISTIVGDIASLESQNQKSFTRRDLTIADPLWHHVTNDAEELSFHVGDVILVLDMSDKDWWWGCQTGSSRHWSTSTDTSIDQEEAGWFPSSFVRLRANQGATADELLEDIKQGTVDTASVVQHYNSGLLSRDQARRNVVNEIITAEREYVKHLRDIVEGFIEKATQRDDMFSERQLSLIFGNISDIYDVSRTFQDSLESTVSQYESVELALVGKCFLQHKSKFEIYSTYCNNHPRALEELQALNKDPKYIQFFEACRLLQNMIQLPLDGFLLTPIQKICKYPLQLGELLKYTSPEHDDFTSLQEALAAMKDMAMLINERKRKLESIQKVSEWQNSVDDWQGEDVLVSSSELIHSGELAKLSSAGRLVDRHFFLFDHQLIQCKKELLKKSLIYKSRILLDSHSIVPVGDGKVNSLSTYAKNGFEVQTRGDGACVLFLCAKTPADKEKWLKCFNKERATVEHDRESGFTVTDSFKALAKLSSTPTKSSKPTKSNSRCGGDGKLVTPNITDPSKDKINNNTKPVSKQKPSNRIIHKLKMARIAS